MSMNALAVIWLVAGLVDLLIAIAVGGVAGEKGRSFLAWFVFGLFMPPFAALGAAIIEPSEEVKRQRLFDRGYRSCPSCLEMVRPAALACPHCGRDVADGPPEEDWEPDDDAWTDVSGGEQT